MKRYSTLLVVFLFGLFSAGCKPRVSYSTPEWSVGDWIEYDVESQELGKRTIRYAITGIDTLHGEPYYWLEMASTIGGDRVIHKMLVPYGYRGVAERMIVKFGDQPAVEMPQGDELCWYPTDENRPFVFLEEEIEQGMKGDSTVTVGTGEYRCIWTEVNDIRHNRVGVISGDSVVSKMVSDTTVIELWVNDSIPLLRIAILKSPREEMKLAAFGHDAVTMITEEPTPLGSIVFE
ncbi:hypothetical protein JXM67_04190 [candidate division WOR-3 bacterium]|nr:hypothetical protein [candidate division WOR-3 bacterium]